MIQNDTLVASPGKNEWMQTVCQMHWNRTTTAEELDGLIQQYIQETILYRKAFAMG